MVVSKAGELEWPNALCKTWPHLIVRDNRLSCSLSSNGREAIKCEGGPEGGSLDTGTLNIIGTGFQFDEMYTDRRNHSKFLV